MQRFAKGNRFGRNHMFQGASLGAGEHGLVELLAEVGIATQDQATTRSPQGLVGGGRHDIAVGHRAAMDPSCHQTSDMGHVGQQIGPDLIGNGAEGGEVDAAGVSRVATNDQLRLVLQGQLANGVEIELLGVWIDAVMDGLEPLARHIDRGTMGEVTPMGEIHAKDRVAGIQQGQEDREIGLGAAVGLHIRPGRAKQLLGPLNRQGLNRIHVLTTAVVALAGQTFGVLVGEDRALGFHHRPRREVLASNQLQVALLPLQLLLDQATNGGISRCQGLVHGCATKFRHRSPLRLLRS